MDFFAFEVGFYLTGFLEQHWCLGALVGETEAYLLSSGKAWM